MRLIEFIDREDEKIKYMVESCSQFFKEVGTNKLYRGTHHSLSSIEVKVPRKDRAPVDTSRFVHDIVDKMMFERFRWHPRSEGVFATANSAVAATYGYGFPYIFVPVNGYKYVYSDEPAMYDMTELFGQEQTDPDYWYTIFEDRWREDNPENKPTTDILIQWDNDSVEAAENFIKEIADEYISTLKIKSLSTVFTKNKGAEIMFKCSKYWLVDVKIANKVDEEIKRVYGKS